MALEFIFGLPHGADWNAIRAYAQTAEQLGIHGLYTDDHLIDIPPTDAKHEAWTVMSMVAGATDRIRLGHQVICQSFRNPALFGKMCATLDALSGGRLIVGLGAGWLPIEYQMYNYPFPGIGARLQQLRETVEICKALWTEDAATYEGRHYKVEDAICLPKPAQRPHPPIMIGGAGEKVLLRLVAEHAQIWNNFQTYFTELEHKLDVLRGHCDAVGRDMGEITIAQQTQLILASTEAEAKRGVAEEQQRGGLGDPEVSAVWGHPQRAIDEIARHAARGIDQFWFRYPGHETLERFATDVLPHVNAAAVAR